VITSYGAYRFYKIFRSNLIIFRLGSVYYSTFGKKNGNPCVTCFSIRHLCLSIIIELYILDLFILFLSGTGTDTLLHLIAVEQAIDQFMPQGIAGKLYRTGSRPLMYRCG